MYYASTKLNSGSSKVDSVNNYNLWIGTNYIIIQ